MPEQVSSINEIIRSLSSIYYPLIFALFLFASPPYTDQIDLLEKNRCVLYFRFTFECRINYYQFEFADSKECSFIG